MSNIANLKPKVRNLDDEIASAVRVIGDKNIVRMKNIRINAPNTRGLYLTGKSSAFLNDVDIESPRAIEARDFEQISLRRVHASSART